MIYTKLVDGKTVRNIRYSVFSEEQGYPAEKLFDNYEDSADFIALCSGDDIVGCGRFYRENDSDYHIDNIALKKEARGKGLGKILVESLIDSCKKCCAERVTVNAKTEAIGFYEKCGFACCGCEFKDENFSRVPMVISFEFDLCDWVAPDCDTDAFFSRKIFEVHGAKRVVLRLGTLGFSVPYINGIKLTEEHFLPAFSDYHERDLSHASYPIFDTFCHRRYYTEYDVTHLITEGKNVFAAHVGGGWYKQTENNAENMPVWGVPSIIFCIEITNKDGKTEIISSDDSVKFKNSYVKKTNIYTNETIDGREFDSSITECFYDDTLWHNMKIKKIPPAVTVKQNFSGDVVDYSIAPKLIFEKGNTKIYDLEKDVSGFWIVRFFNDAVPGDTVNVSMAEAIDADFNFLLRHTGGEWRLQKDVYICGNITEFSPVFSWRAGRFVKIEGNAELVRFDVVYSPVPVTSKLSTSNENLAWFFDAFCNTQNCNIHGMIPSDCPHRERLGYTGDGQLCSSAVMTLFDSEKMYLKWLDDIADCQDIFTGHVQHTAPFMGGGGGPGGWGSAIIIVPWNFYKKFGNRDILKRFYPRMVKYLEYMASRCENNIVVREEKDGWCLGDWCPPENKIIIPESFVNTYFYIKCLLIAKKAADIIGACQPFDYSVTEDVKSSFVNSFFDADTGSFAGGVQGADAFALDLGLGDERTLDNLVAHYKKLGHYDTGIFGTDIVTRVLFEKGFASLAWELMTNDSEISFSYMRRHGATTLWENWDGCDSLSHPMFGAVSEYIFSYLLGIQQTDSSCGYDKVAIKPAYLPQTGDISGSIKTVHGTISVEIHYCDSVMSIKYTLPEEIEIQD